MGYTRNPVIEDRGAVGDGTVSLAKRTKLAERTTLAWITPVLTAKITVLAARDVGG